MRISYQVLLQLHRDLGPRSCVENSQDPVRISSWDTVRHGMLYHVMEEGVIFRGMLYDCHGESACVSSGRTNLVHYFFTNSIIKFVFVK